MFAITCKYSFSQLSQRIYKLLNTRVIMFLVFDGFFYLLYYWSLSKRIPGVLKKYLRIIYSYFVLLLDNSIELKPTAFDIKKR